MSPLKQTFSALVAAAAVTTLTAGSALAFGAQRTPQIPVASNQGSQWMTTANGCSYSRTQAPGYGVVWVLILNPHHIGQPNAHRGCAPTIRN